MKAIFICACLPASVALSAQRLVPSQFQTIQQAITAAVNGDEVVIVPGTYSGTNNRDINPLGKSITIRSQNPADLATVAATIIDAGGIGHRGFYIRNNEPTTMTVDGLTIRNGGIAPGGGIYISSGSPTIRRCIITLNSSGGISCGSGVLIDECIISSNSAASGGGISMSAFNPASRLRRCTIQNNTATNDGGGIYVTGAVQIDNCLVHHNHAGTNGLGGGVYASSSPPTYVISIRNCTLSENSSHFGAGVYGSAELYNSILWENVADSGNQIYVGNQVGVSFSDIHGGQTDVYVPADGLLSWYGGNISVNPIFAPGGYQLAAGSPCIDAARNSDAPAGVTVDLAGAARLLDDTGTVDSGVGTPPIIDMGAYEFTGQTSGSVDSDGDGVPNPQDQCPNTIPGAFVGTNGCPQSVPGDLDHDGDVDQGDFGIMQLCLSGADIPANPNCSY